MSGWTRAHRKIWDHPLFKGNALRVGAWLWMIHSAAWKDGRFNAGGAIIPLSRGQFCASQAQICAATGMTRKQLRGFLAALEKEHAVGIKPANDRAKAKSIITICKYEEYQSSDDDEGQGGGQTRAKQGPTNKEGKNTSLPSLRSGKDADPAKAMFDSGVDLLCGAGMSEKAARTLIGRWKRDHGETAVISAIGKAVREGATDPTAFIAGCFRAQAKRDVPQIGDRRQLADGSAQEYGGAVDGWLKVMA